MSDRPMTLTVEVWPVAADAAGLWLLSGDGPRPSLPIMDDCEPHDYASMELIHMGAADTTELLHSTSWRTEHDQDTGRNFAVLTYMAVVNCSGPVRADWPQAKAIHPRLAEVRGRPPTHGPVEPATVRHLDVLFHGLRHLRFLLDTDATARTALDSTWRRHLASFEPAIARMYDRVHESA